LARSNTDLHGGLKPPLHEVPEEEIATEATKLGNEVDWNVH
jgi:hypothetical protein